MSTEAVTEGPILFKADMVRAILEDRKRQTRRLVKWNRASSGLPQTHLHDFRRAWVDRGFPNDHGEYRNWYLHVPFAHPDDGMNGGDLDPIARIHCPYGDAGDHLWVKEPVCWSPENDNFYFTADNQGCGSRFYHEKRGCHPNALRSIFLPRWASRLTLEITGVRVERLQDISEADAKAEGVLESDWEDQIPGGPLSTAYVARHAFESLWAKINGRNSWDANPWVWVIEFHRLQTGGMF